MKNKIWIFAIVGVITIIIVGYLIYNKSANQGSAPSEAIGNVENLSPIYTQKQLEKVYTGDEISKWGFGVAGDYLCLVKDDFSIIAAKIGQTTVQNKLYPARTGIDAAKILSTGNSCLVQLFAQNSIETYFIDQNGKAQKVSISATEPAQINGDYYAVWSTDKISFFDNSGEGVQGLDNTNGSIFKVAKSAIPIFQISDYDQEERMGNLYFWNGASMTKVKEVGNVYSLFANNETALVISQTTNQTNASLLTKDGKMLRTIANVDPASVASTPEGFYFATNPLGVDSAQNTKNSLGFVSNRGDLQSLLNSQETAQLNLGNLVIGQKSLFGSNGSTVWKLTL